MTFQTSKRPKTIKLNFEQNIIGIENEKPVSLKKDSKNSPSSQTPPKKIEGKVCIRSEKKGRAGKPVSILTKFTDHEAKNESSLKHLCSQLQTRLACGGTVENNEIILMCRDKEKLKNVLLQFFSIQAEG
jgi:translation initiation factor 1 (eIF-1/SUI1)